MTSGRPSGAAARFLVRVDRSLHPAPSPVGNLWKPGMLWEHTFACDFAARISTEADGSSGTPVLGILVQ